MARPAVVVPYLLVVMATLAVAQPKGASGTQDAPVVLSEIKSGVVREYVSVRYARDYSANFVTKRGWYKVTLTCQVWVYNRECSGVLKQEDGKSVTFDPDAIADKIMHSELLPVLAVFARKAKSLDEAWYRNQHDSFVDGDGTVWIKQPQHPQGGR